MLSGVRALVADDDPQLLDTVCEVLTRLDADVVRASNGADQLDAAASALAGHREAAENSTRPADGRI
jgi:CheY-like chemotaxis protein